MQLDGLVFLAPWTGAAAGVLSGAVLAVFYLLKLRRRPVRVSSTLLWVNWSQDLQVNVPLRWLRVSWLFFLQVLVLFLVAAAIGRPGLSGQSRTESRMVLVVDRSGSMLARDGAGPSDEQRLTRLEEAKGRAVELLRSLPGSTEVAVIALGGRPVALSGFSRDREQVARALRGIEGHDEAGDAGAALKLAGALLGSTGEESEGASAGGAAASGSRVVLFSDGWFDGAAAGSGGVVGGAGSAKVELIPVGRKGESGFDNVGLVAASARRDFKDPTLVRVFARVQSVTDREQSVGVVCRLGDAVVATETVELSAGRPESPSEAAVSFELSGVESGLLVVELARSDELPSDDSVSMVIGRSRELSIVLVRPDGPKDEADLLLIEALESLGGTVRAVSASTWREGFSERESGANLVVFDRVTPEGVPEAASISLGAGMPGLGVRVEGAASSEEERASGFTFWQRTHALMRYVVLSDVWIGGAGRVVIGGGTEGESAAGVEVLASGASGPLIVLVERGGIRRVFVGFDVGSSTWLKDASFHVFLRNATDHLTLSGDSEAGRWFRTNEDFTVRAEAGASALRVDGPVRLDRDVTLEGDQGSAVPLGPLSRAGVYRIDGAVEEDRVAAVNMCDGFESRIGVSAGWTRGGEVGGGSGSAGAGVREIWYWFVGAAAALLLVEWMLYAWKMRV